MVWEHVSMAWELVGMVRGPWGMVWERVASLFVFVFACLGSPSLL